MEYNLSRKKAMQAAIDGNVVKGRDDFFIRLNISDWGRHPRFEQSTTINFWPGECEPAGFHSDEYMVIEKNNYAKPTGQQRLLVEKFNLPYKAFEYFLSKKGISIKWAGHHSATDYPLDTKLEEMAGLITSAFTLGAEVWGSR